MGAIAVSFVAVLSIRGAAQAAPGASPDPAYAPSGRVLGASATVDFAGLLADGDGLLAYGATLGGSQYTPALWQLTSAGRLGTLFGGTGRYAPSAADESAFGAATRLADGGLLVAGTSTSTEGVTLVTLRKLTAAGTPDVTFGVNGVASHQNGIYRPDIEALVELDDGSIVYAGRQYFGGIGGNQRYLIGRVDARGARIDEFPGSHSTYESDGDEEAYYYGYNDAALVGAGKVLVVGDRSTGGAARTESTVRRINSDGTLDATFGSDGVAVFRPRASLLLLNDITFDRARHAATGQVIVAGMELPSEGNDTTYLRVMRLQPSGAIDSTFGGAQGVRIPIYGGSSQVRAIERPDGGVYLLLSGNPGKRLLERDLLMVSLNARGALDTTFDRDGMSVLDAHFSGGTGGNEFFQMSLRPDGKVWVVAARAGAPVLWLINGTGTAAASNVTPRVSIGVVRGGKVLPCGRSAAQPCLVRRGTRVTLGVTVTAPRGPGQKVGGQVLYGPSGVLYRRPVNGRQVHGARRFAIPAGARNYRTTMSILVPRNDAFANSEWSFAASTTTGGRYRRSVPMQVYVAYQ